jgi:hypothetical protein
MPLERTGAFTLACVAILLGTAEPSLRASGYRAVTRVAHGDTIMRNKVLSIATAGSLLLAMTLVCSAQSSAQDRAPGQRMQDKGSVPGQPGASGYAPGQRMQEKGSKAGQPGASGYAPGQQNSTTGQSGSSSGRSGSSR